jgi:hypothetical protein
MLPFQLEYILDEIIAEVFFPGLKVIPKTEMGEAALATFASATVLKEVFIRLFLKATNSQLGRKVDLFNSLTNEIQVFGQLVSEDLKSDLREAVKIRNSFAHFPIYFEATGEPPSQDLSAVFVVRGEKVLLTSAVCAGYKGHLLATSEKLSAVAARLSNIVQRVDTGEAISLGGRVWLGHVALDADEWQVRDPSNPLDSRDFIIYATKTQDIHLTWGSK